MQCNAVLMCCRVDRTYKLHIGGKQVRPDAPYVRAVVDGQGRTIGQVPEGNRKDLRNAVEACHAAFPGWSQRAAHNRAQIVYYMCHMPCPSTVTHASQG